jgi:hypothetical protein
VLLDCAAEVNTVDEKLAMELGLSEVSEAELPTFKFPNSVTARSYRAYRLCLQLQDSWGRERSLSIIAYSMIDSAHPVILGLPGLRQGHVLLDCETKQWRWKIDPLNLQIEKPDAFLDTLKGETYVYAVLVGSTTIGEQPGQTTTLPPELRGYEDVANEDAAGTLPEHHGSDHAIELEEGAVVPYGPLYNLSPRELEILREYLADAKQRGWIRESTSPAGAPILFVPKKDGRLRLCVDYRGLNKVTRKNRLALPLISETLDRLCGAERFTKLDLKDAYHRIRIRRGDEWKTAFRTRYGHFEYLVMPFGLTNAPATFQGYINRALAGYTDVFCVIYLDDILIFTKKGEDHWDQVRQVLDRLRQYSLFVNLRKCVFATQAVEFLGFIVRPDGVEMDPRRVEAVVHWPTPISFRDVQIYLGFANFYRRFIKHFSVIARPITDLLKGSVQGKKSGPFQWTEEAEQAKRQLSATFATAPLLRHYNPELPSRLETDASFKGYAAIFSQKFETGNWHPVAFWSRKLSPAEQNYDVHDLELGAIVEAVKHWRHYVEGLSTKLEVLTDHDNLRGFMGVKALTRRQAGWAMLLAAYDFDIKHRPGKSNPADGPSRRPVDAGEAPDPEKLDMLPSLRKQLQLGTESRSLPPLITGKEPTGSQTTAQQGAGAPHLTEDVSLERFANAVEPTASPSSPADFTTSPLGVMALSQRVTRAQAKKAGTGEQAYEEPTGSLVSVIRRLQDSDAWVHQKVNQKREAGAHAAKTKRRAGGRPDPWVFDSQGILRHKGRLYVPPEPSVRAEILQIHHDDPLAGHFGRAKTLELIARKYFWLNMESDVKSYIDSCVICMRAKALRQRPYGELQSLPQPDGPWSQLTMDFITDLPPSRRGACVYDAIWVVVDRYTKMARYIPTVKTLNATELADKFVDEIVRFFGLPMGIVSDRGSVFTSQFWADFCYASKVKRRLSTAFHPQTDGQTERQNQTLEQYLRSYVEENQKNWASLLPLAEFAYNNSQQATIGTSPFYACYGFHPRIDCEPHPQALAPAAAQRAAQLAKDRESMEKRWRDATERQARYYNNRHKPQIYRTGDLVLLSTKNLRLKLPSRKLAPLFVGPYRVVEPVGTQAYRLLLPTNSRLHPVFNVSRLKPYQQRVGEPESLPGPLEVDDVEEQGDRYEVEALRGKRNNKDTVQYLVKWQGWPEEYNEWVEEKDIDPDLITTFKKKK